MERTDKQRFDDIALSVSRYRGPSAHDERVKDLKALLAALDAAQARARTATQRIVEAIGATGPDNLEDALGRLLQQFDAAQAKVKAVEQENQCKDTLIETLQAQLAQERRRRDKQSDYAIQLQRLIESLQYDKPVPYEHLYHHKIIVEFKQRFAHSQEALRLVRALDVLIPKQVRLRIAADGDGLYETITKLVRDFEVLCADKDQVGDV